MTTDDEDTLLTVEDLEQHLLDAAAQRDVEEMDRMLDFLRLLAELAK